MLKDNSLHVRNGQAPSTAEKLGISPSSSETNGFLSRSNARKSRFTDEFLDAKERLEDELLEKQYGGTVSPSVLNAYTSASCSAYVRNTRIVLSADTVNMRMGIEVYIILLLCLLTTVPSYCGLFKISAVPDPQDSRSIASVEILRIEDGRVSDDGRLRVGDQILEIDGQKCSEVCGITHFTTTKATLQSWVADVNC